MEMNYDLQNYKSYIQDFYSVSQTQEITLEEFDENSLNIDFGNYNSMSDTDIFEKNYLCQNTTIKPQFQLQQEEDEDDEKEDNDDNQLNNNNNNNYSNDSQSIDSSQLNNQSVSNNQQDLHYCSYQQQYYEQHKYEEIPKVVYSKKQQKQQQQNYIQINKCGQKKELSTNVLKNFIYAMLSYTHKNQQSILRMLEKKGIKHNKQQLQQFFRQIPTVQKKKMYTVNHFKSLIAQKNIEGQIMRISGIKFLEKEYLIYFSKKKYKNNQKYLFFKNQIRQAFYDPDNFTILTI